MSSSFSLSAGPAGPATPATPAAPATPTTADAAGPGQKRSVCDHCRRRRIRCDGKQPCQPCTKATLVCKRDHIPLKRGPKRGRGRVINELRGLYAVDGGGGGAAAATAASASVTSAPSSPGAAAFGLGDDLLLADSGSAFDWLPPPQLQPEPFRPTTTTTRCHYDLVPRCVDLYYEHIYPIMPLPHMPTLHAMVARGGDAGAAGLSPADRSYVFALCALTSFRMAGQNMGVAPPSTKPPPSSSWESAGRFFLDECLAARQAYDFYADTSLNAVASSFWLSTSFFEINQSRKSWVYLREALTLAQDLRLHDDAAGEGLDPAERLCRQRMFWQLFVTERSFAILRCKPITLKKTPALPSARHPYESPEIHAGFLLLISAYSPLDESFVNAWNEGSDPRVTANTYLALQRFLALPPPFLTAARKPRAMPRRTRTLSISHFSGLDGSGYPSYRSASADAGPGGRKTSPGRSRRADADDDDDNAGPGPGPGPSEAAADDTRDAREEARPETTDMQKADLLITQQWLRLIVWQSSFRQQLLSWTAADESMRFAFPLTIASRTAAVIQSLPAHAIEVHGMGMFEKIFEIGTWSMNVLQAYKRSPYSGNVVVGGGGSGSGSGAYATDPLAFFVRTLSASPNSRTQFAERLLLFAGEHGGGGAGGGGGGPRVALSPRPSGPSGPASSSSPSSFSASLLSSATSTTPASPMAASPSIEPLAMAEAAAAAAKVAATTTTTTTTTATTTTTTKTEPPDDPMSMSSPPPPTPRSLIGAGAAGAAGAAGPGALAAAAPGTSPLAGLPAVVGGAVGAGDHVVSFSRDWAASAVAAAAGAAGAGAVDGLGDFLGGGGGGGGGGEGSGGGGSTGGTGTGAGYTFSEDLEAVSVGYYDEEVSRMSRRSSSSGGVGGGGGGSGGGGGGGGWAGEGWPPFAGEYVPDAMWQ